MDIWHQEGDVSRVIVCSFHTASGSGGYGGKTYYWDFSEMFGPWFTDKHGKELKKQPGGRSHAFKAFEIWHKELLAERSAVRSA
jgi:hypothetical protein